MVKPRGLRSSSQGRGMAAKRAKTGPEGSDAPVPVEELRQMLAQFGTLDAGETLAEWPGLHKAALEIHALLEFHGRTWRRAGRR